MKRNFLRIEKCILLFLLTLNIFKMFLLILERERKRERDSNNNTDVREKHGSAASCMSWWGYGAVTQAHALKGIRTAVFWCLGHRSTNWVTLAKARPEYWGWALELKDCRVLHHNVGKRTRERNNLQIRWCRSFLTRKVSEVLFVGIKSKPSRIDNTLKDGRIYCWPGR